MARSSKALSPKTTGTAVALIDDQLAAEAAALKALVGQPSGNRIKLEATGDFILPDGMNLGNELQVVVVDAVRKNLFYSGPYNPNQISPPDCFAIGKDEGTMAPDALSPAAQSDSCGSCSLNVFGTGNNGKSKACKNTFELALLIVDPENPDAHNAPDAPLYTLSLPPTSMKAFAGAANYVQRMLNGPPIKAILTLSAKNAGTYAVMAFNDPIPNPDYATHFARRAEAVDMLNRKPDYSAATAAPARKPARQAPGRQQPAPRRAAGGR